MKKSTVYSFIAAVLIFGTSGCSTQELSGQTNNESTTSTELISVQSDVISDEDFYPLPEIEKEIPMGTVMGADAFLYADEWELPLGYRTPLSKDGDNNKNDFDTYTNEYQYYDGSKIYEFLPYKYYQELNAAKPDMRKITAYEFVEILRNTEFSDAIMQAVAADDFEFDEQADYFGTISDAERSQKIYQAVRNIQYFADGFFDGASYNSYVPHAGPLYYYWPDSNERSKCRTELSINYNTMTLIRNHFDEYGDLESTECLYSYPYELEKAAFKKYGCSEERKAKRMEKPYKKTEYKTLEAPDTGKKLVGKEVLVPESEKNETLFKTRYNYFQKIQNQASYLGFGELELQYQKAMTFLDAYPNMQKITAQEVVELFDKAKIYEDIDYSDSDVCRQITHEVINEIQKVQYYPDAYSYGETIYLFWPDGDTVDDRRQEIQIFGDECLVRLAAYDDKGNRTSLEDIFDLQEKVKDIDSGNGTREKYPAASKITEEDIRRIFENVEVDPNIDANDKDVCLEWMQPYMEEIEKIQSKPDSYLAADNIYIYYPDANNVKDRRVQIEVIPEQAWVILRKYKNNGTEKYYENVFYLNEYQFKTKLSKKNDDSQLPTTEN